MSYTSHDLLDAARRAIPEISVEAVAARRTQSDEVVLLDVREKEEVRAGYIEGAITIPRGFLEFQAAAHLPQTEADIVVYCASGARSLLAAQVLRAMGYTRVASMAGGITRWQAAGYPVVRDRQLSAEQLERYSRHFLLPQLGEMARANCSMPKCCWSGPEDSAPRRRCTWPRRIGTLGIVDADVVDRSNLQRQVLHTTDRVGMPKTASAALALHALNPDVQVRVYPERLTVDNVMALFQDYDVIVDGSDNFPTRYLVNDAAVLIGKPVVHGSIFQFESGERLHAARGRATAASTPLRPRRAWCRRAVRSASWGCCPG